MGGYGLLWIYIGKSMRLARNASFCCVLFNDLITTARLVSTVHLPS